MVSSRGGWLNVWSVNRTNDSMGKYVYGPRVAATQSLPTADFLAGAAAAPAVECGEAAAVTAPTPPRTAAIGPSTQARTDLPDAERVGEPLSR